MRLLSIDPGQTGAIAALHIVEVGQELREIRDLPTWTVGKDVILDSPAFAGMMEALVAIHKPRMILIERAQPMPQQGVVSTFNYGRLFGALEAIVHRHIIRIEYISPSMWKRMAGLTKKNKDASLDKARQMWPDKSHYFDRKKDHNRAEAALLGYYGWKIVSPDQV